MTTKRKAFSKAFKEEAVRLLEQGDNPPADIARELGVKRNQLYKWQEQLHAKGEDAFPGKGRRTGADDELARLKRENEQLKEENEILKKAAVDSIGQCNTTCSNQKFGGMLYGTIGSTRYDRRTETRGLVSLA